MKRSIKILLTSLFCLFVYTSIYSIPARKNTITVIQPDGKKLSLFKSGDEFYSYYCTTEGYIIEKDSEGIWKYMTSAEDGSLEISTIAAHNKDQRSTTELQFIKTIDPEVLLINVNRQRADRIAEIQKEQDSNNYSTKASINQKEYSLTDFPTIGEAKGLIILAEFKDVPFSLDSIAINQRIYDMLNKEGYSDTYPDPFDGKEISGSIGSARDYFIDQSFGKFSPSFDVIGPIKTDHSYQYYGSNYPSNAANTRKLIEEMCNKAYSRGLVNFSDYDNNNDNKVDFVFVIFSGRGEAYTGSDENTIWPHYSYINKNYGSMRVSDYACSSELFYDTDTVINGIGTFCHEFSHILGLPDFYNTQISYKEEASINMDSWSLMDYGVYDNNGFTPAGYTAFERYTVGWMDLIDINDPGDYLLPELNTSGIAYRLRSSDKDQFIILENHQQKNWYQYQYSKGLLATAVYYDSNSWKKNAVNTDTEKKRFYILPADNDYSDISLEGDLFPYGLNDSLTMYSSPATSINKGEIIDIPIYGITNGDTISFNIRSRVPNAVSLIKEDNLEVTSNNGEITISAENGERYSLFSITGISIESGIIKNGKVTLSLPSKGFYFIHCCGKTIKVVK